LEEPEKRVDEEELFTHFRDFLIDAIRLRLRRKLSAGQTIWKIVNFELWFKIFIVGDE
jgi:hypothetical protein